MVATISGVLQRLQHLCVVHRIGNWLIGYLTLDPGVGVFGLLGTLFGPGTGWLPARFWSLGRMWFILMVPALSVLVMSKIPFGHMSMQCFSMFPFYFHALILVGSDFSRQYPDKTRLLPIESATTIDGYGVGLFNASLADFWAPISDLTFSITFNEFLSDASHAVDISSPQQRKACESLNSVPNSQDCQLKYFFTGSIENVAPELLAQSSAATADAFLSRSQTGLLLEFGVGTQQWEFELSNECHIYGAGPAAWALCLKNDQYSTLQARRCP
jgi:hypothetical protein